MMRIRQAIAERRRQLVAVRAGLPRPAVPHPAPLPEAEEDGLEPRETLRGPVTAGLLVLLVGFGGFFAWAFTARLDSAAVASGLVISSSQRKTISHFEGGVLKKLLVTEGEVVEAGQPLLLLDDTRARAELEQLKGERIGLLARLARLRAEQQESATIDFGEELTASPEPMAAKVVADETRLFTRRRETYQARIASKKKEIEQYADEMAALDAQIAAGEQRKALLDERLGKIRGLAEKGYATQTEVTEIAVESAELAGDIGEYRANRQSAERGQAGARFALLSAQEEWHSEVAAAIQEAQLALNDVEQRILAAEDVLQRLVVRAPQRGTVLAIQTRTRGSAIAPGQPLMDLVPEDDSLVIEARVNPRDIEVVGVGTPAQIRLTAYNARRRAPFAGHVTYVAADQTIDERSGRAYYTVRAEIEPGALDGADDIALRPGMPADLVIINEPRTAISYFFDPISDSFYRAFREQ